MDRFLSPNIGQDIDDFHGLNFWLENLSINLYDLEKDPCEIDNLIRDPNCESIRRILRETLLETIWDIEKKNLPILI